MVRANLIKYNFSDEIRINPVPKSVESVSKELIKLKWDSEEVECFNGFGPWMKPAGFQVNCFINYES